jgi:predicted outer membrane protein
MSSPHASISSSTILAALAMVGAVAFAAGRESLPSPPISPFTICSAATEAAFPAETPYLRENDAAMARMMAGLVIRPTGDVDRDFVAMMTPHHQGAIEMAEAVLRNGRNEQIRRLAQEIIVTQQQEIATMRLAVGEALPPTAVSPTQVSVSSSPVLTRTQKAGEPP